MRKLFVLLLLVFIANTLAMGNTVISVTSQQSAFGDPGLPVGAGPPALTAAVGFTIQRPLDNVSISVNFIDNFFGYSNFTAYLTDGIGSQATASDNLVDPISFTAPWQDFDWVPLWTNIHLDAGPVYLVIAGADDMSNGGWGRTTSPVATVDPTAAFDGDLAGFYQYFAQDADVNPEFAPASNFGPDIDWNTLDQAPDGRLMYSVTTPEPGTLLLLGTALIALGAVRRRIR